MKSKRLEEIKRLVFYAKGMGLRVFFRKPTKSTIKAEWTTDGSMISIYRNKKTSKIDIVLSLIHELGHHKDFINYGRRTDILLEKALDKTSRKAKKAVLKSEIAGTKYWEQIYRDTNCCFNINRLFRQMEYDVWVYQYHYDNKVEMVPKKIGNQKTKELRVKYGC